MARDLPLVVESGLCVGCGACAAAEPQTITMRLGTLGGYLPVRKDGGALDELPEDVLTRASAVCPFSGKARNEDSIGQELFDRDGAQHHAVLGYHQKIVAGHVEEGEYRELGTSGGLTSWVLAQLFEEGEVDAVVHVASTLDGLPNPLSRYTISRSIPDLFAGRKSRYHVQTLNEVMDEVRTVPGRYAIVGVPCFIKAVRLLADQDEIIRNRVVFGASLFCGHIKSTLYSDYLARSVELETPTVRDIDYRHKEPGRPPNRYCSKITTFDEQEVIRGAEQIPMANWGIGIFKLGACDYCDDITGETADISFGDAWLPPFMSDWRGTNVAVARSQLATRILDKGEACGELDVVEWSADKVAESQAGAVRHRRPGLAVRLANRVKAGLWVPQKRVAPASDKEVNSLFAQRMINREAIAVASGPAYLRALKDGGVASFIEEMKPYIRKYDGSRSSTIWRRAATWVILRLPAPMETALRRMAKWLRFS